MPMLKALLLTTTGLAASCAVPISDEQFCAPIPGNRGAACDNFLTSRQLILTQAEWVSLQSEWQSQGLAIECTTSQTVGDIKREIEKLCSLTNCDYEIQTKIIQGLNKIQSLGKTTLP